MQEGISWASSRHAFLVKVESSDGGKTKYQHFAIPRKVERDLTLYAKWLTLSKAAARNFMKTGTAHKVTQEDIDGCPTDED